MAFRKILVPTDFSECARRAMGAALTLAKAYRAEIVLVHIAEPAFDYARYGLRQQVIDDRLEEMRTVIDEGMAAERRLFGDYPKVRLYVGQGRAADEICALAERERADVIVMSTHGHTGFRHLMLGSTAERVVRQAPCSVLTVHGI